MPWGLRRHSLSASGVPRLGFEEEEDVVGPNPLDTARPVVPGESITSAKSRVSFEYALYILSLSSILCYGFYIVAEASRLFKHLFYLGEPRWKLLALPPFHSVGYNGSGDTQWMALDYWLLHLVVFFFFVAMGSKLIRWSSHGTHEAVALQFYHVFVGVIFVAFLHGPSFVLPITFFLMNYLFAVKCIRYNVSYSVFMTFMWLFQVGLLLSASYIWRYSELFFDLGPESWWRQWFYWYVVFNMSTLRMIAFNMDMYEAFNDGSALQERAVQKHDTTCVECAQMRESNYGEGSLSTRCYKFRTECPCQLREYNLLSYMAYMLYVPLYIAGPMSSFNAFVSHLHSPTLAMNRKQMILYAFRILFIYVVLVSFLHFAFVNAFRTHPELLIHLSVSQVTALLYYSLAFLWLKFSLIWKLSRLAAVLGGVDVPEDMRRCFTNTVSVRDFWRDWHASFNLWIVRYMYIPMGGNKKKHLNIFPIFFFIAMWHDVDLHLIKWAGCIVFVFVLELLAVYVWNLPSLFALRHSRYQRLLRSFGAVFSTFGLIVANLIGFSKTSSDGEGRIDHLITGGLRAAGPSYYFVVFWSLFCLVSMGIIERDGTAVEWQRLKKRYKLK